MPKLMRRCGLRICICQCPCISRKQVERFRPLDEEQAAEELEHAHKLIDYALDRGGDITIGQINVVPTGGEIRWRYSSMFTNTSAMYQS